MFREQEKIAIMMPCTVENRFRVAIEEFGISAL